MLWHLKYDEKVEYEESRVKKGYNSPILNSRPDFDYFTSEYLKYYFILGHFRKASMSGHGSINLCDIIDYHDRVSPFGELDEFISIMIAVDRAFLKHYSDLAKG